MILMKIAMMIEEFNSDGVDFIRAAMMAPKLTAATNVTL